MTGIQLLDGTATHQLGILPYTPESNLWLAQGLEIESMNTLRGRMQRHTLQVRVQQLDNLRAAQIIYANIHMSSHLLLFGANEPVNRWPAGRREARPTGRRR